MYINNTTIDVMDEQCFFTEYNLKYILNSFYRYNHQLLLLQKNVTGMFCLIYNDNCNNVYFLSNNFILHKF